jgi:hypothetical protein
MRERREHEENKCIIAKETMVGIFRNIWSCED